MGLSEAKQAVSARPLAAEYQRSYYQKRKRLGVCVGCGRKAQAGRTKCGVCLMKDREMKMVQHPVFCVECKRPIKSEERSAGRRLHKLCAQKRQARRYPSQHRSAALAYRRRHKEMGLCLTCPQRVFRAGYCRKHYRMAQGRYRLRDEHRWVN